MNILDLLKQSGSPIAYVQGHHTRIVAYDEREFEVLSKRDEGDPASPYTVRWYLGSSEQTAVEEFIKSEES